jgi:hypothetical protein
LSSLEIELIGKEKEHYDTLEELYAFSNGHGAKAAGLAAKLQSMIVDWDRMQGNPNQLTSMTARYVDSVEQGSLEEARTAYLILSPIFLFIRALGKASRKDWREAVTACGIFCERVVRNAFVELDRVAGTSTWSAMKSAKFEDRNGRLMKEFEIKGFDAASLHGSLKRIYFVRDKRGPHDVSPPEPIQAKICINECLPVYVDYLAALEHIGVSLAEPEGFVEIFSNATQVRPALAFGEETSGPAPIREVLVDAIYREGFFRDGRTSGEVLRRLGELRRNYDDATVKNALRALSAGRDAVLSRKERGRFFVYYERIPPEEYFKPIN